MLKYIRAGLLLAVALPVHVIAQDDMFRLNLSAPIYFSDSASPPSAPKPSHEPSTAQVGMPFVLEQTLPELVGATWSDPDGLLPSWATLDSSSGRITGVPSGPGQNNGIVLVASLNGVDHHTVPFSISTNFGFGVDAPAAPTWRVGGTSATLATQSSGSAATWSLVDAPNWMTIVPSTGEISGTPPSSGTFSYRVRADVAGQGYSFDDGSVAVIPALAYMTQPAGATFDAGSVRTIPFAIDGSAIGTVSTAIVNAAGNVVNLPWLTIEAGAVRAAPGTTISGDFGPYRIRAIDSTNAPAFSSEFTLKVQALALQATAAEPTKAVKRYSSATVAAPTVVGGNGTVAWSLQSGALPAGLTLRTNGTLQGQVTGALGTYNVVIRATSNGQISDVAQSIVVNQPLTSLTRDIGAPVQADKAYSVAPRMQGAIGTLSFAGYGLPAGVSVNPTTGVLTGVAGAYNGSFNPSIMVTDSGDGASVVISYAAKIGGNVSSISLNGSPVSASMSPDGYGSFDIPSGGTATFTLTNEISARWISLLMGSTGPAQISATFRNAAGTITKSQPTYQYGSGGQLTSSSLLTDGATSVLVKTYTITNGGSSPLTIYNALPTLYP